MNSCRCDCLHHKTTNRCVSRRRPPRDEPRARTDHLTQELVMLVTDMMLQRFFTTMLM